MLVSYFLVCLLLLSLYLGRGEEIHPFPSANNIVEYGNINSIRSFRKTSSIQQLEELVVESSKIQSESASFHPEDFQDIELSSYFSINDHNDHIEMSQDQDIRQLAKIYIPVYNSTNLYVVQTGRDRLLPILLTVFLFGIIFFRIWDTWDHDYIVYVLRDRKSNKLRQLDHGRKQNKKKRRKSKDPLGRDREPFRNSLHRQSHRRRSSIKPMSIASDPIAYTESTNAFFDDAMMSEYLLSDGDLSTRIYHTITHRHQYLSGTLLSPFFGYSLRETRTIRWVKVGFTLFALIFVGAVVFQRYFTDDGTCESYPTIEACQKEYSRVLGGTTCEWTQARLSDGSYPFGCHLRPPPHTASFTIILATITIFLTLPLKIFSEYVLDEYCSKRPNLEAIGLSSEYWLGSSTQKQSIVAVSPNVESREHVMDVDSNAAVAYYKSKAKHRLSDIAGISEALFRGQKSFLTYLAPEEEVKLLLAEVKQFLTTTFPHGYVPSIDGTECIDIMKYRVLLQTIADHLHIDSFGMTFPLTFRQRLIYGDHWHYLESKIIQSRKRADYIYRELKTFGDFDNEVSSKYLLQQFVIEQLPFFRRYTISKNFFQYDDISPNTIDPFIWLFGWFAIFASLLFICVWIGIFATRLNLHILFSWGLNFALGVMIDIFFVQILKNYVLNILVISASQPQLKKIRAVLRSVAQRLLYETDELEFGYPIGLDGPLRVVQHLSGACRVSRYNRLSNLFAARLLRSIDDVDIENCKDAKSTKPPFFAMFCVLFTIISMLIVGSVVSDLLLHIIILCWSSGFVVANLYLYHVSPLLLMTPYAILALYFISRLGILQKLIDRHRQNNRRYSRKEKVPSWFSCLLDLIARITHMLLYPLLSEKQFIMEENQNKWKSMNEARDGSSSNGDVQIVRRKLDSVYKTIEHPIPRSIAELLPHADCLTVIIQPQEKYTSSGDSSICAIEKEIEMKYLGVNPTIFPNSCSQPLAQSFRDSHVTFDVSEAIRRLSTAIQEYQDKYCTERGSHFQHKLPSTPRKPRSRRSRNYIETVDFASSGYDGYHPPELYCLALEGVSGHRIPTVPGIWDNFYPSGKPLSTDERREIMDSFVIELESTHPDGLYFSLFQRWFLLKVGLVVKLRQFDATSISFLHKRMLLKPEGREIVEYLTISDPTISPTNINVATRGNRKRLSTDSNSDRRSGRSGDESSEGFNDAVLDERYIDDTAASFEEYATILSDYHMDDDINRLLYSSIKDIIRHLSKFEIVRSNYTISSIYLQDLPVVFQFFIDRVINAEIDDLQALRNSLTNWMSKMSLSDSQSTLLRDEEPFVRVSDFILWLREKIDSSFSSNDNMSVGSPSEASTDKYDISVIYGSKISSRSSSFMMTKSWQGPLSQNFSALFGMHALELRPESVSEESKILDPSISESFPLSFASTVLMANFHFKSTRTFDLAVSIR